MLSRTAAATRGKPSTAGMCPRCCLKATGYALSYSTRAAFRRRQVSIVTSSTATPTTGPAGQAPVTTAVKWGSIVRGMAHWNAFSRSVGKGSSHGNHKHPPLQQIDELLNNSHQQPNHPPPVQHLHVFESRYTAAARLSESFDANAFPYHLTPQNKKTFKTLLLAGLSSHRFAAKNIVLSSPHPGAVAFMEKMAKAAAREIGADVLTLDFVDVLKGVKELDDRASLAASLEAARGQGERGSRVVEKSRPTALTLSDPFHPSTLYMTAVEDAGENEVDEEHDDEYDEEGEEEDEVDYRSTDPGNPYQRRYSPWTGSPLHGGGGGGASSSPTPLMLHLHAGPQSRGGDGASSRADSDPPRPMHFTLDHPASSRVLTSLFPTQNAADSTPDEVKTAIEESIYSESLSSAQLTDFAKFLVDFIKSRCGGMPFAPFANLQSSRKLVLYVKDMTDLLVAPGGKELAVRLLDAVKELRTHHRIPVVLVTGCSPSLVLPGNIGRGRDTEFYTEFFAGRTEPLFVPPGDADAYSSRLWSDGKIFATPLDKMTTVFEKIELAPPALYLVSPHATPTDDDRHRQQHWLEQMKRDMHARILQLNLSRIEVVCAHAGLAVRPGVLEHLAAGLTARAAGGKSKGGAGKVHALEEALWTRVKAERLVGLAVGVKADTAFSVAPRSPLDVGAESVPTTSKNNNNNNNNNNNTSDLEAEHFEKALAIMRESDRPAPVPDGWGPGGSVAAAGQDGGGSGSGSHHLANSTGESTTTHDGNLVAPETPTTNPSLHTATPTPTPAPTPHSHPDLTAELKRANITLNAYEKKLLTTVINPQNLTVSFSDLVLPSHTKTLLQTLTVLPLLKPHYYTAGVLARHSITGVLLFGPPGTGKSLLAKALAKHSAARFMSVALSDVYDKYVGEGEKNVKAIFTLARKLKPCVVFLDEVDALFARRGGVNDMPTRREVVNEFMSEWDGLGGNNQGLVIVGATNRPFDLDDAILRRMPRRIMVDLPKQPQRHAILSLHLRGEHLSPTLDLDRLARRTEKYSGSDLKNLCVAAALARIRDAVGGDEGLEKLVRVSGGGGESDPLKMPEEEVVVQGRPSDEKLPPLSNEHFETALKQVAPSLTDEMQTLVELKKWDERYGERKDPDRRGRDVWGFNG